MGPGDFLIAGVIFCLMSDLTDLSELTDLTEILHCVQNDNYLPTPVFWILTSGFWILR
jgi:hypothetical protein